MKEWDLYSEIVRFLREEEYYSILANFISYHRIQGTEEMQKALLFLKDVLNETGVYNEYYEEEMVAGKRIFGFPYFRGYKLYASKAIIRSSDTVKLDFCLNPHTFIQRSRKIKGKFKVTLPHSREVSKSFVLCKDLKKGIYKYLYEKNAEGILLYSKDAPRDARKKAQFWYYSNSEKLLCGVVLTPIEWEKINDDLKSGKNVVVEIEIAAEFPSAYNAYLLGTIEGEEKAGILYVAHACHAKGEANDNGSGAASVVYAASVMKRMIDSGIIPRPPYTVYFLLVPEMWGSGLFIEKKRDVLERVFAGLNFDMVGSDLIKTGGKVFLEDVHGIIKSNITDIYQKILLQIHEFLGYPFGVFRRPFEGGSDHLLFQEPSLNIPMPMLIHWPDRFYHTDKDVVSNLDTKAIWRNILMMIALPYLLDRKKVKFNIKKITPARGKRIFKIVKQGVYIPTMEEDISTRLRWYKILEKKRGYVNFMNFLYYLKAGSDIETAISRIKRETGKIPDREVYEKYVDYLVRKSVVEYV